MGPGERVGDYVVDRMLGEGGMSWVYEVHGVDGHPNPTFRGRCFALKLMKPDSATANDRAILEASNAQPVPVGVKIHFDRLQNVATHPARGPYVAVVPAGRRAHIVSVVRQSARHAAAFPFKWQWVYGDPGAEHAAAARYRMPFGGKQKRVLSQGVGGRFSHQDEAKYSFDWSMPIGTPILAAREGIVVDVADGYTKAGTAKAFLREANAITVMHPDRTFATYAHLDPGAGVREGMQVFAGDVIGFSGNTGYSTGPHLHFSVWKAGYDGRTRTLPIRFHDPTRAAGFVPKVKVAYRPGCHAEGIPCKPGERPQVFPAKQRDWVEKAGDGTCRCKNGAVITTHLPCRMVCP